MVGTDELCFHAMWDDAQMSSNEAEGHVASLIKIIEWMTRAENWTAPVAELLEKGV